MAKAAFHKHQRVWVECVGAWAVVEKLIPVWTKGFEEPIRITYELGLGREFQASELAAESAMPAPKSDAGGGAWRILRARNKQQTPDECGHHPHPGTFPVVVTDPQDWGGWRVPGAEYDRDPERIERQARLIAAAPSLLQLAKALADMVADAPEDAGAETLRLAKAAAALVGVVTDSPRPSAASTAAAVRMAAE